MRGLLSALWAFLQHPAASFGDHLIGLEERLRALEGRFEDTLAGAENRLEADLRRAIHARAAEIQARLETVKVRVVEELKRELHRMLLVLALAMGCAASALATMIFALMAAWTELKGFMGAVGASSVLAILFLLAGLVVFGLLRSVLHRSRHGA